MRRERRRRLWADFLSKPVSARVLVHGQSRALNDRTPIENCSNCFEINQQRTHDQKDWLQFDVRPLVNLQELRVHDAYGDTEATIRARYRTSIHREFADLTLTCSSLQEWESHFSDVIPVEKFLADPDQVHTFDAIEVPARSEVREYPTKRLSRQYQTGDLTKIPDEALPRRLLRQKKALLAEETK